MRRTALLLSLATSLLTAACSETGPTQAPDSVESAKAKAPPVVKSMLETASIDAGLAVGAQAPLAVKFKTKDGETSLGKILDDGPAVLVFTRSVEWCPYCQTQFKAISAITAGLDKRGYNLFGISYDSPEHQDRFSMNQMLTYRMLSDEPSAVIDAFGLRDPQYTEGRAVGVPYASVIVVNKEGQVTARIVSSDFKMRPTNEQILALVDSI